MAETAQTPQGVDRNLLRSAGEHLGTLAERARKRHMLTKAFPQKQHRYNEYVRLSRLSREVLEIAND